MAQYVIQVGVLKAGLVWWQVPEGPSLTVSWPPVQSAYSSQTVWYEIVDTSADTNTKWMASAAIPDTTWTFDLTPVFEQGAGLRQVCVHTVYKETPEPCPECEVPTSILVIVCDQPDKCTPVIRNETSEAVCVTYDLVP